MNFSLVGNCTLCDASITSSGPEVKVCLQRALTVDPAFTSKITSEGAVGFGPPLHCPPN